MKPTKEQITAEITSLADLAIRVREFSIFGDNNREAIRAQVEVLKKNLSEEAIFGMRWKQNVEYAALDARIWLDGNAEEKTLSENWTPLATPRGGE